MLLGPDYPVCTARLILRPLVSTDTEDLVAYRSLDEGCRFVPFEPMDHETVTERLQGAWACNRIADEGQELTLGVELSTTGHVVGDVVLFFRNAEHRSGEIGWVFHPGHSGRGYATEASHALLHLAFDQLGLHRVIARVDARNEAPFGLAIVSGCGAKPTWSATSGSRVPGAMRSTSPSSSTSGPLSMPTALARVRGHWLRDLTGRDSRPGGGP